MAKYKLAFSSQEEKQNRPKGFDDFELRLGDTLRGERATIGKSVVEVQNELKIKAAYITAIETAILLLLIPQVLSRDMSDPMLDI